MLAGLRDRRDLGIQVPLAYRLEALPAWSATACSGRFMALRATRHKKEVEIGHTRQLSILARFHLYQGNTLE